jgi:hypothetical protein
MSFIQNLAYMLHTTAVIDTYEFYGEPHTYATYYSCSTRIYIYFGVGHCTSQDS